MSWPLSLAVIPKFSGGLSICGSSVVIYDVLRDAHKRQTTYHRLVLGISVSDVISSITFFLGTWIMPVDTVGVVGAFGTVGSCTVFGFTGQIGILATPLYNGVLATYYLLMLKYEWSTTRLKRIEPYLHAFVWIIALVVGIIGLVRDLYGAVLYLCWIKIEADDAYRMWFVYYPIWASLIYMITAMVLVYFSIRNKESKSKLPSFVEKEERKLRATKSKKSTQEENQDEADQAQQEREILRLSHEQLEVFEQMKESKRKSHRIMVHAFMYLAAISITWSFSTISRIYETTTDNYSIWMLVVGSVFTPLQGLLNSLIYFRYKIAKWFDNNRSEHDDDYMDVAHDHNRDNRSSIESRPSKEELDLNQWIAGKDKTGMGGLHFEENMSDLEITDGVNFTMMSNKDIDEEPSVFRREEEDNDTPKVNDNQEGEELLLSQENEVPVDNSTSPLVHREDQES